jgi:hypothetical protein
MTTKVFRTRLINHIFIIYFIFSLPVSIEFTVSIQCNRHRIILECVFHPLCFSLRRICLLLSPSCHPCISSISCVFLSLCLFIVVIIQIYRVLSPSFPWARRIRSSFYTFHPLCFSLRLSVTVVIISSLHVFDYLCFLRCVCSLWS